MAVTTAVYAAKPMTSDAAARRCRDFGLEPLDVRWDRLDPIGSRVPLGLSQALFLIRSGLCRVLFVPEPSVWRGREELRWAAYANVWLVGGRVLEGGETVEPPGASAGELSTSAVAAAAWAEDLDPRQMSFDDEGLVDLNAGLMYDDVSVARLSHKLHHEFGWTLKRVATVLESQDYLGPTEGAFSTGYLSRLLRRPDVVPAISRVGDERVGDPQETKPLDDVRYACVYGTDPELDGEAAAWLAARDYRVGSCDRDDPAAGTSAWRELSTLPALRLAILVARFPGVVYGVYLAPAAGLTRVERACAAAEAELAGCEVGPAVALDGLSDALATARRTMLVHRALRLHDASTVRRDTDADVVTAYRSNPGASVRQIARALEQAGALTPKRQRIWAPSTTHAKLVELGLLDERRWSGRRAR